MELKAIIANLEKYNNGHFIGERVSFPVSEAEIAKVFYRIGINGSYKEYFIAGYEGIWSGEIKNEYVSIEWLNSVAEHLQKFDENILSAALECWTLYDVLKMRPDDLRIHTGIHNEYDLGRNFIKESGFCSIGSIAEHFICECLGSRIVNKTNGGFTSHGFIEYVGEY